MAGNETVFSPDATDEQVHSRSEIFFESEPTDIGGLAIQAAEASEVLDIRFFMRRSADTLVEMGLLDVVTDPIVNNYFRGLREAEGSDTDDDTKAYLLLRLAAGCTALSPREDKKPIVQEKSPEDEEKLLQRINTLEHIKSNAFKFFLELRNDFPWPDVINEIITCINELSARELWSYQNPTDRHKMIDVQESDQEEVDEYLENSYDRYRKLQAITFNLSQKGLASLIEPQS